MLDNWGIERLFAAETEIFLFSTAYRLAMHPPILLSSGYQGFFPGNKVAGV
jgi:hypothetical protein